MRRALSSVVWTCDICGHEETLESGSPRGWIQITASAITGALGNASASHACADCAETFEMFGEHRLGDAGDLAQAWDDGLEAGRDRWCDSREFGEPPVNPYRKADPS